MESAGVSRPDRRSQEGSSLNSAVVVALIPLVLMFLISAWGFAVLPAGVRIPLHFGLGGANQWASKRVGLLLFPGVGIVLTAFELAVASTTHQGPSAVAVPMGVILVIVLLIQMVAVSRARGR